MLATLALWPNASASDWRGTSRNAPTRLSTKGPVQREHPDDHGGKRHEVEHDDLFPGRAGAQRAFPQTRAEHDGEYHGGDGADREQGQADRPEPVGKTPDVARDKGEYRRRSAATSAGQPDRKPPGPVGPQHAEEEAQVAGDDPGDQAEPVTVGRYRIAEFLEP